jgi:hypothetical protein
MIMIPANIKGIAKGGVHVPIVVLQDWMNAPSMKTSIPTARPNAEACPIIGFVAGRRLSKSRFAGQ